MKFLKSLWDKFKHNIGWKIASVVAAVVLWMYITNSNDPIETKTFYEVPVTIMNEENLTQKDKIVEVIDGSNIVVTVEARRSVCNNLTADSIKAVADFDKTSSVTEMVPIEVSVVGYTEKEVEIIRGTGEYMRLSLEDYASKEFKVTIKPVGVPAEGYVVDSAIASPNVITVSGSKMQLSRIQEVVVTVNVDSLSGTSTINLKPVVYDMNDDVIDSDKLTLSESSVQVTTAIYPTKTINILVNTVGDVDPDYEVGTSTRQPESVMIAGKPEELSALFEASSALTAKVDVSGCKQDVERTIDINSLINPELYPSVHVVDNDSRLAVKVTVTPLQNKEIVLSAEDISFVNTKEHFDYRITALSTRKINVKATKGWLEGLTIDSLKPLLDFDKIEKAGSYTVPVAFGDFQGIDVLTEVTATVIVSPNVD